MKVNRYLPHDFCGDYYRASGNLTVRPIQFMRDFLFQHRIRFMYYYRYGRQTSSAFLRFFCKYKLYRLSRKFGIEMHLETQIGPGFVMGHPYNITISPDAIIGKNVSVLKGATIGMSGGKKPGAPRIGDCVYIGLNATIIGGIIIGDDVMIAPNAFVNCDIPSHSIVIGNPCKIIPRENATSQYIYYRV